MPEPLGEPRRRQSGGATPFGAWRGASPRSPASLASRANLSLDDAVSLARNARRRRIGGSPWAMARLRLTRRCTRRKAGARLRAAAVRTLADFHRRNPLREGMTREELRSRLRLRGNAAQAALDRPRGGRRRRLRRGGAMRLPEHAVAVTKEQQAAMDAFRRGAGARPVPRRNARARPGIARAARGAGARRPRVAGRRVRRRDLRSDRRGGYGAVCAPAAR